MREREGGREDECEREGGWNKDAYTGVEGKCKEGERESEREWKEDV